MNAKETLNKFLKDEISNVRSGLQSALQSEEVVQKLNFNFYNVEINKLNNTATITTIMANDEPAIMSLNDLRSYIVSDENSDKLCKRCQQAEVRYVNLEPKGEKFWVCDECEAVWFKDVVSKTPDATLEDYLKEISLPVKEFWKIYEIQKNA